jgi:hypothetical protein
MKPRLSARKAPVTMPKKAKGRVLHQHGEHPEDLRAVLDGGKFGVRTFRPAAVVEFQLADRQFQAGSVDRHLGLDLEARRHRREALDEATRKYPVAGEDIGKIGAEDRPV